MNIPKNKLMTKRYLAILLSVSLTASACSDEGGKVETGPEEIVKTVNVSTKTIETDTFSSYLQVVGTVETTNDILISSEVSGRVVAYNVGIGQSVKKGDVILKIDDTKLKQEKNRLESITAQANDTYTRLKKIYEEDNIGSELDYLNAKHAYDQSNSALKSINVDLANTSIKAPFNGRLETKLVEEGEMVSPGMQVVRLIGSDEFVISAGVPARYADVIKQGDKVEYWFDSQAKDTLSGTISYVGNSINTQNRTFSIETKLPNKDGRFKVDMIANMRLKTLERNNVIIESEEFIYSKKDGYVVYVYAENEEGKQIAEERFVSLGPSYKTEAIIESGLEKGDKLITIGSAFLNDGMRINVINKQEQPLAAQ